MVWECVVVKSVGIEKPDPNVSELLGWCLNKGRKKRELRNQVVLCGTTSEYAVQLCVEKRLAGLQRATKLALWQCPMSVTSFLRHSIPCSGLLRHFSPMVHVHICRKKHSHTSITRIKVKYLLKAFPRSDWLYRMAF